MDKCRTKLKKLKFKPITITFKIKNLNLECTKPNDLKLRIKYANCVSIEKHLDIICLTETWLTCDIADEVLFLEDYTIPRRDRKSDPQTTKLWSPHCHT